jgi:hypothetical protein
MGSDVGRLLFRRVGLVVLCLACVRLQAQTDTRHEIELHYRRAQEALQAKQDAVAAQEFREIQAGGSSAPAPPQADRSHANYNGHSMW